MSRSSRSTKTTSFLLNTRCYLCSIHLSPRDGFIFYGRRAVRACQDCVRGRCHFS
jgi:hypothetical protein